LHERQITKLKMKQSMNINLAESTEIGSTGIYHLKRLWSKTMLNEQLPDEQELDNAIMSILGLGLLPMYQFLFGQRPTFEAFEQWVVEIGGGTIAPEKIEQCNQLLTAKVQANETIEPDVLSAEDIDFWNENGYVVLKNAISHEDCVAARQAIWDYLQMDENNSASWYNNANAVQGIMVPLYRNPAIDKNRNAPKIRKAFEQLWGQNSLIVTTDKCGFNPPQTNRFNYRGTGLHWDVSLAMPIPFGTQGILYLTDTAAHQGALTLIPCFHKTIEMWLTTLPKHSNPREFDFSSYEKIPIAANAGDFIIWNHKLPHSSSPNNANLPRLVQYINWYAPLQKVQETWI
jgi:ectoine hydroxylase-related dioxygenase (phytanoyl-CoA dioxygenase family)